jgi:hypothetical protein
MPLSLRRTAPAVAIALLAISLTGCSIVENVAQGAGVSVEQTAVPTDFPADQVPLLEGEIVFGGAAGADAARGWNVSVRVTDGAAWDAAAAQLEGAGFTATTSGSDDPVRTGTFTKAPYTVILVVSEVDGAWMANYAVTQTGEAAAG